MGCSASIAAPSPMNQNPPRVYCASPGESMQEHVAARKAFISQGSLLVDAPESHLELRLLLDDALGFHFIQNICNGTSTEEIFSCWTAILQMSQLSKRHLIVGSAERIYVRFVQNVHAFSTVKSVVVTDNCREALSVLGCYNLEDIPPVNELRALFQPLFVSCFGVLHDEVFLPLKLTAQFQEMKQLIRRKSNGVEASDFQYLKVLGVGGFAGVFQVRKVTTGRLYAMKIQPKSAFIEAPHRILVERQVCAACQHPFIVQLAHAFHTETVAVLVLSLGTGGDLEQAMHFGRRLPYERVIFYAAELVLALGYMHRKGLIHRDLKPSNVVLTGDGHIQLVDFGAVVDVDGLTMGVDHSNAEHAPSFGQSNGLHDEYFASMPLDVERILPTSSMASDEERLKCADVAHTDPKSGEGSENSDVHCSDRARNRANTVVGTLAYMAPEMIGILVQRHNVALGGYTKAVDWWSLGVMIYKLLAGKEPFNNGDVLMELKNSSFVADFTALGYNIMCNKLRLFEPIDFDVLLLPSGCDVHLPNFIRQLLDVDESNRLGAGFHGTSEIEAHPVFKGVDWKLMNRKGVKPPCVNEEPGALGELSTPLCEFTTMGPMLKSVGRDHWLQPHAQIASLGKYFADWNYSSVGAILEEHAATSLNATTLNN